METPKEREISDGDVGQVGHQSGLTACHVLQGEIPGLVRKTGNTLRHPHPHKSRTSNLARRESLPTEEYGKSSGRASREAGVM